MKGKKESEARKRQQTGGHESNARMQLPFLLRFCSKSHRACKASSSLRLFPKKKNSDAIQEKMPIKCIRR